MMFSRGQPVICVNDNFAWARKRYPDMLSYPVKGQRYIVREYVCWGRAPAIVLREIKNPRVPYMDGKFREAGFWDRRFIIAPLPESISNLQKTRVDEDA